MAVTLEPSVAHPQRETLFLSLQPSPEAPLERKPLDNQGHHCPMGLEQEGHSSEPQFTLEYQEEVEELDSKGPSQALLRFGDPEVLFPRAHS